MEGSWKKFYQERRGKYKSKFPFLKEDQITAKLKRIWYKERTSNWSGGTYSGGVANRHRTRWKSAARNKKPANGGQLGFCCYAAKNELCQENVAPCQASPYFPSRQASQKESPVMKEHNTGCTSPSKHPWETPASSPSLPKSPSDSYLTTHQSEMPPHNSYQSQMSTPPSQQPSPNYNTSENDGSSCCLEYHVAEGSNIQESATGDNILCAMFAPLRMKVCESDSGVASHGHATPSSDSPSSGSKYCLFLNEGDIFM